MDKYPFSSKRRKMMRTPSQPEIDKFLMKKQPADQPKSTGVTRAEVQEPGAPGEKHSIQFHLDKDLYQADCTDRMTVLEALNTHGVFNANKGKGEAVIARKDEAVVSTHFPCCLINSQEELRVSFIPGSSQSGTTERQIPQNVEKEQLVTFNIETKGKERVVNILGNPKLASSHSYVCVYGTTGEKVLEALKRDGRFKDSVLEKNIVLQEVGGDLKVFLMLNNVDDLKGKVFSIMLHKVPRNKNVKSEDKGSSGTLTGNQNVKIEASEASNSSSRPQSENPDQVSTNTQPKKIKVQEIPNTGEILKLLRDQYEGLVKQLKERESLTKPAEVQRFFREEYDKSVQSFSEVKRVKELMKRSDSVCLIRVMGSGRGTGFLLCDRFILTNAHVVEDVFDQGTWRLRRTVTAVFGYEGWGMGKELEVKADVVAYCKDEQGQHLDFALLELAEDADLPDCPELLSDYSLPPTKGGVCIIGHPDVGVKRMDPCFVIENVPKAVERHLAENSGFVHVITQECLGQKFCPSQINYDSCFFHGSSGSPVFNDHCQLIGVHTGGYAYKGEGGRTRSVMEYALPVNSILEHIDRQCREKGRPPVVGTFEAQSTMSDVIKMANEPNQGNQQVG